MTHTKRVYRNLLRKETSLLRKIRLVWVTDAALQTLLNDKYKLESLQGDGSTTRQAIPQNARWKARACNCWVGEILTTVNGVEWELNY